MGCLAGLAFAAAKGHDISTVPRHCVQSEAQQLLGRVWDVFFRMETSQNNDPKMIYDVSVMFYLLCVSLGVLLCSRGAM